MSLCVGCVTFTTTKVGKLRPVSWHSPKSKQTNEISHAPFKFLKKIPSSSKSIFAAYDTLNILHSFLWNFSCVLTVLKVVTMFGFTTCMLSRFVWIRFVRPFWGTLYSYKSRDCCTQSAIKLSNFLKDWRKVRFLTLKSKQNQNN